MRRGLDLGMRLGLFFEGVEDLEINGLEWQEPRRS